MCRPREENESTPMSDDARVRSGDRMLVLSTILRVSKSKDKRLPKWQAKCCFGSGPASLGSLTDIIVYKCTYMWRQWETCKSVQ